MNSPRTDSRPIIILGAGVIGLTTAVRLLESSLYNGIETPVHIIADHLPNDHLDPKYASTIAGAHHLSFADDNDSRQRRWDQRTFNVMHAEWRKEGDSTGLMMLKQTEFYVGDEKHLQIFEEHPDFSIIEKQDLPESVDHAVSFTSLTMTPTIYLNRLLDRLDELSSGSVVIHRHHLPALSSLIHPSITAIIGTDPPRAVIVCAGIGALTLGDVEDDTVFPTRGQVVKVHAPWIKSGFTRQVGNLNGSEGGERTYVIPRANGEVILGGTRELDDWFPYPRPETTADILQRVAEMCPALCLPHEVAAPLSLAQLQLKNDVKPISDLPLEALTVTSLVGFRPSRKAGIRLERGPDLTLEGDKEGRRTAVIYNYGHGGAGWQSCWGTAEAAISLLRDTLGASIPTHRSS